MFRTLIICSLLLVQGCASVCVYPDLGGKLGRPNLSRRLAGNAYLASNVGHDLQLLLAVAAYRAAPTHEAKASLLAALNRSPRLQKMLWGHRGVTRIAYSPDGKRLASASGDGSLMIFDVDAGLPLMKQIGAHSGWIWHLEFGPQGDRLLSIGEDSMARFWRVGETLTLVDTIDLKSLSANSFELSGDWKRIAIASSKKEGDIEVLESDTRKPVAQLNVGKRVDSVALSRNGSRLVTVAEGFITLWNLAESPPQRIQLNEKVHFGYRSALFSPDDSLVASARWSDIDLWDAKTGSRLGERVIRVGASVNVFAISKDGQRLAVGTNRDNVEVYSLKDGQRLGPELGAHKREVYDIAFDPSRGIIASASWNSPILLWSPDAHSPLVERNLTEFNQGFFVHFSAHGGSLVGADIKNAVVVWNAENSFVSAPRFDVKPFNFRVAAASGDGRIVATAGHSELVYVWEVASGKLLREIGTKQKGNVGALALSPAGTHLAASGTGGEIELWNLDPPASEPLRLTGHTDTVRVLKFSPDGKTLASGGDDATVRLWRVSDGGALAGPLRGHVYPILALAFSPDGRKLASGGDDMRIRVWDVRKGRQRGAPLVGHKEAVISLEYSTDGKRLYSSGQDSMILVWEEKQPAPLALRPGWIGDYPYGTTPSYALSLDPGGHRLATADGVIRIWYASEQLWVEQACMLANRNLYRYEWRQFFPSSMAYAKVCPQLPEPVDIPVGME